MLLQLGVVMIGPMYQGVLDTGRPVFVGDQLFTPARRGGDAVVEAYFTFSYSAIPDEAQRPAGVLATVFETTRHMRARRRGRRASSPPPAPAHNPGRGRRPSATVQPAVTAPGTVPVLPPVRRFHAALRAEREARGGDRLGSFARRAAIASRDRTAHRTPAVTRSTRRRCDGPA